MWKQLIDFGNKLFNLMRRVEKLEEDSKGLHQGDKELNEEVDNSPMHSGNLPLNSSFTARRPRPSAKINGYAWRILSYVQTAAYLYNIARAAELFAVNLKRYLAGQTLQSLYDPHRGY